jgi:hypothetical protein
VLACADLVVLDGDPFDEPSILWDESLPRNVVKNGHIVATGDLGIFAPPQDMNAAPDR